MKSSPTQPPVKVPQSDVRYAIEISKIWEFGCDWIPTKYSYCSQSDAEWMCKYLRLRRGRDVRITKVITELIYK